MKNTEKITLLHDHLHSFLYEDVLVMQTRNIFDSYKILFEKENFERVIEIGTAFGGLPLFIRNCIDFKKDIVTYDIKDQLGDYADYLNTQPQWSYLTKTIPDIKKLMIESSIDFRPWKDCFNQEIVNEISSLIQKSGKTLLICDGGNKAAEVNLYSQYLKRGDILLGHDYFKNGNVNYGVWNCCELTLATVNEETTRNGVANDNEYSLLFENSATYIGIKQ